MSNKQRNINTEFPRYLIQSPHKITVNLIGVGGTGGWVLGDLCALDGYLKATGRPGLQVFVFDEDIVTEANLKRQNFNELDLGENKAIALVEKYNRYHGLDWVAYPRMFSENENKCNITISCVDNIQARRDVKNHLTFEHKGRRDGASYETTKPFFWIDTGNGYDYGQVIISHILEVKKTSKFYPEHTFFDVFGDDVKENKGEASCSLLESLGKQNLFINKFIANLAVNWLYQSIRTTEFNCLGYHFNFNGLNPIPVN
jgi:PRTRC genetic system ThiF family protein